MNRKIFEVLPEFEGKKEFIDSVMDENGKDIEKAKGSLAGVNKELEDSKKTIDELKETIATLEKSANDVEELKKTIDGYKEKERLANEEKRKATYEQNMQARFDALVKDSQFVNDFTKVGAYEQFKKMIEDKNNEGKGDSQIYAELTKGNDSWFKSKQSFVNMQGLGNIDSSLVDVEAFKKMSLLQQMTFATNHPNEYAELSKMI